jgi:hypothetical protein
MFQRKKIIEYTGDIIVCLDKAYKFSDLKNGRVLIGNLTRYKITSQKKNIGIPNENDLAVPVFICNRNAKIRDKRIDWAQTASPIVEIDCDPIQRWWPKAMFRCSQKIGEQEEIFIKHKDYYIKLYVIYAFSKELKDLFKGIEDMDVDTDKIIDFQSNEDRKPIDDEPLSPNNLLDFVKDIQGIGDPSRKEIDDEEKVRRDVEQFKKETELVPVYTNKQKPKLKIAIGITAGVVLSVGLFFMLKFFSSHRS